MKTQSVYEKIIVTAESLIQQQGYNAFSYRDIAAAVGIKTSSIHYYFPTKADLAAAVVKQHVDKLCRYLDEVVQNPKTSYSKKLHLFFDGIFSKTYLADRKMCLGGMLASDVLTLPENLQLEVRIFFNRLEEKLTQLLKAGIKAHTLKPQKNILKEVRFILTLLEGGLLFARLYQDESRLEHVKTLVLERFL